MLIVNKSVTMLCQISAEVVSLFAVAVAENLRSRHPLDRAKAFPQPVLIV
jgi:hypothetical protein